MADYQLTVKVNGVDTAIKTIGQLEDALQNTREELKNLEIGSDAFNDLTNQARQLQGELDRTFERATNFNSSLTIITESVSRLGSSVAAGFSLVTSSLQLLGDESEELSEAQVKAQEALAIAFSATTIATNASTTATDLKVVADRLSLVLTNSLTAAVGKEAIAKAAAAAATGTATVAQRALNAAMAANPIGLLLTALTALVAGFVLYKKNAEDAADAQELINLQLEAGVKSLELNVKATNEEIKNQRNLIKVREEYALLYAETEEERIRIREKSLTELKKLDLQELESQQLLIESRLNQLEILNRDELEKLGDRLNTLSNFYDNLDEQTQEYVDNFRASYIRRTEILNDEEASEEARLKAQSDYYNSVLELQEQSILNDRELSNEEKREQLDRLNSIKEYQLQLTGFNNQRRLIAEQLILIEKSANAQIEANEKDSNTKRLKALEQFNKTLEDLSRDRSKTLLQLQADIESINFEDIINNFEIINRRTGEIVNDFAGKSIDDITNLILNSNELIISSNDDIIRAFDIRERALNERLNSDLIAIEEAKAKELEIVERAYKDEVIDEAKRKEERAKIINDYADRVVAVETISARELEKIAEEKALKILEIEKILQNEISFGNNSLNDSIIASQLQNLESQREIVEKRIELEGEGNAELISLRTSLNRRILELTKESAIQQRTIELEEALKTVQGTEQQKGEQRKRLIELYNNQIKDLIQKFNLDIEILEKESSEKSDSKIEERINRVISIFSRNAQIITDLYSSINSVLDVEVENSLRSIRDYTAEQTSILNESYNRDLQNLESNLNSGIISREQYNKSVEKLNAELNKSQGELELDSSNREKALQKQAFEREKKLKITQAIISGLQGAASAYASAFTYAGPAAPIVGSALAALVAATTAAQVAAIKKTQFDAGPPSITPPNSTGVSVGGGSPFNSNSGGITSNGGFTQFDPTLLSRPDVNNRLDGGLANPNEQLIKVVVVESDITNTQRKVKVAESTATFG